MSVPDDVAGAVDTVAGVTGHPVPPTTPVAGDCWAQWAGVADLTQYGDGDVAIGDVDWDVILVLPPVTTTAAHEAVASQVPDVLRAVSPLGVLGAVEPTGLLLADGRSTPAVRIRLTSPEG